MWDDSYNQSISVQFDNGSALNEDKQAFDKLMADIRKPESLSPEEHKRMMKKLEVQQSAKKLGMEPERLQEMREYAGKLKKQFPHMKPKRIERKVAEYFKVKLK